MCDCIKKIEHGTIKTLKENNDGEFEKARGLLCVQIPIVNNRFLNMRTYNDYEFYFTPVKKDGTTGKPKKKTIAIAHTYCPFCGKKHSNK